MKGDLKMDKKAQVEQLTTYMANFVSYIGKVPVSYTHLRAHET